MRYYSLSWSSAAGVEVYQIIESDHEGATSEEGTVVFSRTAIEGEDLGEYEFPEDVRKKYEELTGKPEFGEHLLKPYLGEEDLKDVVYESVCGWAQWLRGGSLYCGHTGWLYAPRKCRRGVENGEGALPQEMCPGFMLNRKVTRQ